ncbi:family 10 glycosylhydrolase [Candidatus Uabimicrobium sp. HlEnr_7]|uniref:family 10 glycosylhydrolase n=1 Tax=Candidatus Uabimicrobium helgolandensis TaxID=3095367 RepID=UPI0035564B99
MKRLFLVMIFIISTFAQEQWRGIWVDAWNEGLYNKQQIQEMLNIAKDYGYNSVAVQIRCRGDALYHPKYPNTEPRRKNLDPNFDPLQTTIDLAHAMNIEVHAWATTFLVASRTPSSPEHVYHKHNEYLTQDNSGNQKISEGYYLDPGHPGALEWNRKVVLDIVENYDIDGYHFDYIRYPQQNAGYNPVAIERFNKQYNKSGQPAANDPLFSQWRRQQITSWLRSMYAEIVSRKPSMKITAATFASRSDAFNNRFQDWATWMKEGIIDANFPMNYARTHDIFESRTDDIVAHSYNRHVYMGIGSYLISVDYSIHQLLYAQQKKSQGVILFSYANNAKSGKSTAGYKAIFDKAFKSKASVPDMPWKSQKDVGHILGSVISEKQVEISIPSLSLKTTTDANGRFSFLYLPQGTYKINFGTQEERIDVRGGQVVTCNKVVLD